MLRSFVGALERNALSRVGNAKLISSCGSINIPRSQKLIPQINKIVSRKFSLFTISSVSSSQTKTTLPLGISKLSKENRQIGLNMLINNRFSSTMKKRRWKMNKHKLRKRRKALRFNTKLSRQ